MCAHTRLAPCLAHSLFSLQDCCVCATCIYVILEVREIQGGYSKSGRPFPVAWMMPSCEAEYKSVLCLSFTLSLMSAKRS